MSQLNINPNITSTGISGVSPHEVPAQQPHIEQTGVGHIPAETGEVAHPQAARADALQDAPAMNTELAGAAAPGKEGFFSRIGHFFSELKEKLFGQGFTLPPSFSLVMPNGGSIEYPSERLVDMIKALPRSERAAAAENIGSLLQERISMGCAKLEEVYAGRAESGPSARDVADVMLFLEAKAIQSGNSFKDGSFSLEDPSGNLFKWLDDCPERYQRSSSHLGYQSRMMVDGHLNTHRGIDFAPGQDGLTSGKSTLLFGTIPENKWLGAERRIFLKMESHGCRLSTLNLFHWSDHAQGAKSSERADRPVHLSDLADAIGHSLSFLATRGKGSAEGTRKERIPDAVSEAYKNLLSKTDPNTPLGAELRLGYPLDKGAGIRVMLHNIQENVGNFNAEQLEATEEFFQALNAMKDHSHRDVRIGNEVIFDRNELF